MPVEIVRDPDGTLRTRYLPRMPVTDSPVLGPPQPWPVAVYCPYLTCVVDGPHLHPICPECQTIRYGSWSCATCRAMRLDGELNPLIEVPFHGR